MDTRLKIKLLEVLVENSARILDAGFGVNCAETTFFDVIRLVRENPELKTPFLSQIESTLQRQDAGSIHDSSVPTELIELAAHEFRWNDFHELAETRVNNFFHGDWSLAKGDISSLILNALLDNWPDREFYRQYDIR